MRTIVFDTGKGLLKFRVNEKKVFVTDMNIRQEVMINPETFEEQKNSKRFVMEMRRSKGEKYFREWVADLEKYKNFTSEEEIIKDLEKDFHIKRGNAIISKE